MKNKTIVNYAIGTAVGVGLAISSAAFAVNTVHNSDMMGTITPKTTPTGMHGQTAQTGMHGQTAQTGMHGQTAQTGMHGQTAPAGVHEGMATATNGQGTPCHENTDTKDKKS